MKNNEYDLIIQKFDSFIKERKLHEDSGNGNTVEFEFAAKDLINICPQHSWQRFIHNVLTHPDKDLRNKGLKLFAATVGTGKAVTDLLEKSDEHKVQEIQPKRIGIMVFGDSVAFGEGDKERGGWVNRLALYLKNHGKNDTTVMNLSVKAATTKHVLNRFESEAGERLRPDKENFVIFALGNNDSSVNNIAGQPIIKPRQFEENITELITKAKKFTRNVIFVGSAQMEEKKTVPLLFNSKISFYNQRSAYYDNFIQQIAHTKGCQFIDIRNLLNKDDLAQDGVHPNENGHEKMFKHILYKMITQGKLPFERITKPNSAEPSNECRCVR